MEDLRKRVEKLENAMRPSIGKFLKDYVIPAGICIITCVVVFVRTEDRVNHLELDTHANTAEIKLLREEQVKSNTQILITLTEMQKDIYYLRHSGENK